MSRKSHVALLVAALASVACGGGGGSGGGSNGGGGGGLPLPATVTPIVAWAHAADGSGTCFTRSVAVSSEGWSVVVGSMDTSISLDEGNSTLASPTGAYTGFIARYDADGTLSWQNRLECDKPCTAYSVAVMTDGDVVVAGYFEGVLKLFKGDGNKISDSTLTSGGGEDGFVARYKGGDGAFIWGARISGSGNTQQALGVAPLSSGAVAVGGLFQAQATFFSDDEKKTQDGTELTASNVIDGFVLKYDSGGTIKWAVSSQGTGYSAVWSVATNASGDSVIAAGSWSEVLTFSSDANGNKVESSEKTSDVFVASFADSDGSWNWINVAGGNNYDEVYSVAVDQNDGSIRLAGGFTDTALFGGTDTVTAPSTTSENAFVAMYKQDGSYLWVRQTEGPLGSAGAIGFSVAIDSTGGTVLIGGFRGTMTFNGGQKSISSTDVHDVFMARFDIDGNIDWAIVEAGTGTNAALGCAILTSDDTIWVCGYYHDSMTLDGVDDKGDVTLTTVSGAMNGFVARFDDDGAL